VGSTAVKKVSNESIVDPSNITLPPRTTKSADVREVRPAITVAEFPKPIEVLPTVIVLFNS